MQTINLKQYYPFCKEDIFVEVSDEIVEAFLLDKRAEAARDRKMFRYKAFYSLDCNDGIENAAIGWAQPSPEDYLIEKEELAEYEELIRRLYEAISSLPPMQARRVHARYMLGMHISYKPLWHTLLERDMRKEDLRLAAGMTTNMIANMSKEGKHISMDTLARICETLNCEITDVIELVPDEPASTGGKEHERIETKNNGKRN